MGNIHLQEDGSVHLSFWMSCADMCGIGKTFVLNRSFDTWQITGNVGPVIVS